MAVSVSFSVQTFIAWYRIVFNRIVV